MLLDPIMYWPDGPFPYDALRAAGITPDSSHREVFGASFFLMERGAFEEKARAAWDTLRILDRRLWVDFLLFDGSPGQLAGELRPLAGPSGETCALEPPWDDLDRMAGDFRPFQSREEPLPGGLRLRLALQETDLEFDG